MASTVLAAPSIQKAWDQETEGSGNRAGYSTPVVAELDGDTSDGKEIVAASLDGTITAAHADGSILWETTTPDSGCGGPAKINSSPAVGKLYGDGINYVVIGYGPIAKRCQGGVIALDGRNGQRKWNFSTLDFAKKRKFGEALHTVFSSPAIADTDGDGKMEIGFGSFDRNVYLLNYNGTVRWYYNAADTIWSSPTFVKVDKNPHLEMIVGTDISANSHLRPITKNGGNLYAFRTEANPKLRYQFRDPKAYAWMRPMEQVLYSSPSVGEIIASNPGPEIVIESGCFFPQGAKNKVGKWARVVSAKTGKVLRTIPIEACSTSKPALADIDGDGEAEIFISVNGSTSIGGDGSSRLEAFNGSGAKLWSIIPKFQGRNYEWGGNFISPIVADLYKNNSKQVIIPVASGVGIYDAATGNALSCESRSCDVNATVLKTGDILLNAATVADVDGDGQLDIVAAGKSFSGNLGIFRWSVASAPN